MPKQKVLLIGWDAAAQGVLVSSKAGSLNADNTLKLDLADLEQGTYIVEISNDEAVARLKFNKK